mmetsp:Transcript_6663/g.14585  ORF Transcript_6663/g.14585 Transcript_6663/m.14585 type:complete len:204 (+) Transcript_6663:343-954(+)
MAVITELSSFTYCSESSAPDNIHYLNLCCFIAGLNDTQKLVILLNGIENSGSMHSEIRAVAGLHKRLGSFWPVTSNAILAAYATLLNNGKISQDRREPQFQPGRPAHPEYANATTEGNAQHEAVQRLLHNKFKDLENGRTGKAARKRQVAFLSLTNNGPNRGPKQQKTQDERHCDHCGKAGHTKDDCWALHPCSTCGATTHAD